MIDKNGWRKSRRSNPSGNCLKARLVAGVTQIGDTKQPETAATLDGGLEELTYSVRAGLL